MKIFLYVINLQTYIVECWNYTEFVDLMAVKDYGIRRYCATMKYRIKMLQYEKIEHWTERDGYTRLVDKSGHGDRYAL